MPNVAEVLYGLVVILGLCIAGLCRSHHVTNQRLDELEQDLEQLLDQWAVADEDGDQPPTESIAAPFQADLDALRKAGLSEALIDQIRSNSREAGSEIAREILAGGPVLITALNAAQAVDDEDPPAAWCDPTYGRIDRDIQDYVAAMHPTDIGQRVAIENTLQDRRNHGHEVVSASGTEEG